MDGWKEGRGNEDEIKEEEPSRMESNPWMELDGIGKQPESFQSMDEFHLLMFQANCSSMKCILLAHCCHFSFIMAVV
jgi:hypothetical protein